METTIQSQMGGWSKGPCKEGTIGILTKQGTYIMASFGQVF